MRTAAIALAGTAALGLSACESTQDKSARLARDASNLKVEKKLSIGATNRDVSVTSTDVLNDPQQQRTAAVVTVRNTSSRPQAAVPLLFSLHDAGGRKLFANDSAGATLDLKSVPYLAPGEQLSWVDDQVVGVQGAKRLQARLGAAKPAAGTVPKIVLTGVHIASDDIDGVTAVGRVINRSPIPQQRLVVYAIAKRGGKVIAAGRAVVPTVKPGPKGAKFVAFFVGDPRKGKLELHAPPTSLEEGR